MNDKQAHKQNKKYETINACMPFFHNFIKIITFVYFWIGADNNYDNDEKSFLPFSGAFLFVFFDFCVNCDGKDMKGSIFSFYTNFTRLFMHAFMISFSLVLGNVLGVDWKWINVCIPLEILGTFS